jgi:plasmid maintenance system antidote protein VapI
MALRVPSNNIITLLAGERTVTAETTLRLARHFGAGPDFWLNPRNAYEPGLSHC